MSLSKFVSIVLATYTTYYLIIILWDILKSRASVRITSSGKQHIDFTITHEPKRASLENDGINQGQEEVKKNFSEQPYPAAEDKVPQESIGTDIKHDLGLEVVSVDGIEVTADNILELIYNTVQ